MSDEKAEILVRLNEGRTVPTFPCDCGSCGNEWFVPGYSDEWMPSFCPYCGIKFIRKTVGDDERPDKYKPRACPAPLVWSSELPRVAGRYWMQCKAAPQYETVWNVTEADVANPPSWFRLNRFAGPLERPMEAKSSTSAASFAADQGGR